MRVIGMLLGIPDADQPTIRKRADDVLRTEPGKPMKVKHGFLAGDCSRNTSTGGRSIHPTI